MKSGDLVKELKIAGWQLKSIKGSHHKFFHNNFAHTVIVPHPKKDLGKGIVAAIRKQAQLEGK